jgi:isopentenyl-diphosphate Delta-isomerase
MKKDIILVNSEDEQIGTGEKMEVHKSGKLHRAFSIFVFNYRGELLLQKRAKAKYHSGGLWTNTCCGHPLPGESVEKAANRRLKEEMGFNFDAQEIFSFCYNAHLGGQMIENEYDHVLFGEYDGDPVPDPKEAEDWKWASVAHIKKDVAEYPHKYTHWFKIISGRLEEIMEEAKKKPR